MVQFQAGRPMYHCRETTDCDGLMYTKHVVTQSPMMGSVREFYPCRRFAIAFLVLV